MKTKRRIMFTVMAVVLVGFVNGLARADWIPDDQTDPGNSTNHKMHFPQLPDINGWDVNATAIENPYYIPGSTDPVTRNPYLERKILADDWTCSETGAVGDIHFWGSWLADREGVIENIHLSIHEDIPDPDGEGPLYSMPGVLRWEWDGLPTRIAGPFTGDQGWFNPNTGYYAPNDHGTFWQYNIEDFADPFIQQEGTIYWLDITVTVVEASPGAFQEHWGWKTADTSQYPEPYTGTHYMDDAVYGDDLDGDGIVDGWYDLFDPWIPSGQPPVSLDLAFVITPEPATMVVLLLGGLAALMRKRSI